MVTLFQGMAPSSAALVITILFTIAVGIAEWLHRRRAQRRRLSRVRRRGTPASMGVCRTRSFERFSVALGCLGNGGFAIPGTICRG
jgi:hypothetical protein